MGLTVMSGSAEKIHNRKPTLGACRLTFQYFVARNTTLAEGVTKWAGLGSKKLQGHQ